MAELAANLFKGGFATVVVYCFPLRVLRRFIHGHAFFDFIDESSKPYSLSLAWSAKGPASVFNSFALISSVTSALCADSFGAQRLLTTIAILRLVSTMRIKWVLEYKYPPHSAGLLQVRTTGDATGWC